ncbi:hypothetical protein CXG81DRAFT_3291, partial [Caulochytrium protostelioides]
AARALRDFLLPAEGAVAVLVGAGISTDSRIPDYRGPHGVYRRNPTFKPIQYHEFVAQHARRQRYWSGSFLGWNYLRSRQPNATHLHLASLERRGLTRALITQNVDGLHRNALPVIELHGALRTLSCLTCKQTYDRDAWQRRLALLNPAVADWARRFPDDQPDVASSVNPDGDVEIRGNLDQFQYPACDHCTRAAPNVVFFGENIDPLIRDAATQAVERAKRLLVVGTSLQVYSSFRLVKLAKSRGMPVAIVNLGETRGDSLADLRLHAPSSALLDELA